MSALQRMFAKPHLQYLPPDSFDEAEEDELNTTERPSRSSVSSNDSSSSASSTGTVTAAPDRNLFEKPSIQRPQSRYEPLPWQNFFEQELYLNGTDTRYHAYFSAPATQESPLFCFHHGAGASGLSFALLTVAMKVILPDAGFLAPDCRGHGLTTVSDANSDFSLDTLSHDFAWVILEIQKLMRWTKLPPIILLGHSMGGAVVTELASRKLLGPTILGYGVLDVVEGSAIDALQSMEQYLSTRPKSFKSIAAGIEWHVRSRTLRNTSSARVSVPPLLREETDEDGGICVWRTDLTATKPYWENWFTGLSSKFLSVPGSGKLLILAGTDRLDKELMIGQMQGRYQLQVFPEAGHFVHEDQAEKTATVVADFYRRNDKSTLVLPPKVGDLIKQGKLKSVNSAK